MRFHKDRKEGAKESPHDTRHHTGPTHVDSGTNACVRHHSNTVCELNCTDHTEEPANRTRNTCDFSIPGTAALHTKDT